MSIGRLRQQARLRIASASLIIGLITFIGDGNATAEQIGPSFDCHAAPQPLAQTLCSDPDLSRTDLRFAQAYFALLKQVGEAGKRELKQEDLQFLDAVQRKCGIPTSGQSAPQSEASRNCVKSAYEAQRAVWVLRLTSPFSEEANRPIERHIELQRLLQQLGLLPADAAMDGVYGAGTREAISKWQSAQGRSVTGVLADAEAQALEQQTSKGGPTAAAIERRGSEPLRPSVDNQPKNDTTSKNADDSVKSAVNPATPQTDTQDCKIQTDPPIRQTAAGLPMPYENITTSWNGTCRDGLAEGTGTLTWYSFRIPFVTQKFTDTNGLTMKGGRSSTSMNSSSATWKITQCSDYRRIKGEIPTAFDLTEKVIVNRLLIFAEQIVWKDCPSNRRDLIHVELFQNGKRIVYAVAIGQQNGFGADFADQPGQGNYENLAYSEKVQAAYKAWNDERIRRQNAVTAEKIRQRVAASHELFDTFVRKNAIETWPSLDQLRANPFMYEGKTVGLVSSFNQMIGRDRGMFAGGVLVSSIPTDAFQSKVEILLAGRVQGNELIETPFGGKVSVPHLKLVDFYICQQGYCEDVLLWQHPH